MPSDRLVLPAPAKLNLFLHVTGRRPDGYHTLESLFVVIGLADRIELVAREDGGIERTTDVPGVEPETDLALRAATLLRLRANVARGADIGVEKRIPMGAGLGGGSSDAATVLLGLNRLWQIGWSRERLGHLALELGADVPFFVRGEAALGRGIGERLSSCSVPLAWVSLVMPAVHVPTAQIFAAPELTRSTPSAKLHVFSEGYGRNDLETVACARFPAIAAALDGLRALAPQARMSGSGGCVFALFATRDAAERAAAAGAAASPGARGIVTRILARHPLATFA